MKILIVGHGEYATGMKSSIKLLTGVSDNIDAINLNEESENQFVIGGVSVGCILEVVMNTLVLNSEDKLENIINTAVNNIQGMTSIISRKDLVTQEI